VKNFRDLDVWEKAHFLTLEVYKVTTSFPREELFGLTSQMRRATASIPSNIAEGCGRSSDPDFARFLQIAMGSSSEVEYQLLLARDLNLISSTDYARLNGQVSEVKPMLTSLIQKVRS